MKSQQTYDFSKSADTLEYGLDNQGVIWVSAYGLVLVLVFPPGVDCKITERSINRLKCQINSPNLPLKVLAFQAALSPTLDISQLRKHWGRLRPNHLYLADGYLEFGIRLKSGFAKAKLILTSGLLDMEAQFLRQESALGANKLPTYRFDDTADLVNLLKNTELAITRIRAWRPKKTSRPVLK